MKEIIVRIRDYDECPDRMLHSKRSLLEVEVNGEVQSCLQSVNISAELSESGHWVCPVDIQYTKRYQ